MRSEVLLIFKAKGQACLADKVLRFSLLAPLPYKAFPSLLEWKQEESCAMSRVPTSRREKK